MPISKFSMYTRSQKYDSRKYAWPEKGGDAEWSKTISDPRASWFYEIWSQVTIRLYHYLIHN